MSAIDINPYSSIENLKLSAWNTDRIIDKDTDISESNIRKRSQSQLLNGVLNKFNEKTEIKQDKALETLVKQYETELESKEKEKNEISLQNDKLKSELDQILLELKQTKMEWALTEERKEECEIMLKSEIKSMLQKAVKHKKKKNSDIVNLSFNNASTNSVSITNNSILSKTSRNKNNNQSKITEVDLDQSIDEFETNKKLLNKTICYQKKTMQALNGRE